NGEGVQGLRRALVLAGSESQVMSLWPVLDTTTRDLMVPYYKALRQGKGRSDGLRQAQLRMLRREDCRHSVYLAAFIQSGGWAHHRSQTRPPLIRIPIFSPPFFDLRKLSATVEPVASRGKQTGFNRR